MRLNAPILFLLTTTTSTAVAAPASPAGSSSGGGVLSPLFPRTPAPLTPSYTGAEIVARLASSSSPMRKSPLLQPRVGEDPETCYANCILDGGGDWECICECVSCGGSTPAPQPKQPAPEVDDED